MLERKVIECSSDVWVLHHMLEADRYVSGLKTWKASQYFKKNLVINHWWGGRGGAKTSIAMTRLSPTLLNATINPYSSL